MPAYDVKCATHGILEVERPIAADGPFYCPAPGCSAEAPQVFRAPMMRVDDSENVGSERGEDCAGQVISLPDVRVSLGKDPKTGKEHFGFRPVYASDVNTRSKFLEAARRAGLSPGDGGRYRTAGQR